MKWIYLLFLCSASAWGLDVGTQNIIDAYLTPRKHQKAPSGSSNERIAKLRDEVESLNAQSSSMTYRMKETEPAFNKKKADFEETSKYSSLYTSPSLREKMRERLQKRCCKLSKEPSFWSKTEKRTHDRWKIEYDKYKKGLEKDDDDDGDGE